MIIKCLSGKFFPKTTKMTPPSTEERISVNEDPVKSLHFENEGGGGGRLCFLKGHINVPPHPPQKKKEKKREI